jgi:hypothetical protein
MISDINHKKIWCFLLAVLQGVLPHDYLAMEAEDKAETLYANALQIVEIYQVTALQSNET